jgi:hypothetical protein
MHNWRTRNNFLSLNYSVKAQLNEVVGNCREHIYIYGNKFSFNESLDFLFIYFLCVHYSMLFGYYFLRIYGFLFLKTKNTFM